MKILSVVQLSYTTRYAEYLTAASRQFFKQKLCESEHEQSSIRTYEELTNLPKATLTRKHSQKLLE